MSNQSNDKNPNGTRWYNQKFYKDPASKPVYPEEDYQVLALPVATLYEELGRRLGIKQNSITWMGRTIDFSAVTDGLLLHTLTLKLGEQ